MSSFQGCDDDSGFSLLHSTSLPNDEQYVKMCASDNCKSLLKAVAAKNPPNCELTVPTSGWKVNVLELTSGFPAKCASVSKTTSPATEAPATTTSAPTTTTPAATEAPSSTPAATTTNSNSTSSPTQPTAC